jgi:hypothetical protein
VEPRIGMSAGHGRLAGPDDHLKTSACRVADDALKLAKRLGAAIGWCMPWRVAVPP